MTRITAGFTAVLIIASGIVPDCVEAYRISGDEEWVATDSPYIFMEDVTVERNATLTVSAGVVVLFGREDPEMRGETPGCHLDVAGTLIVAGEPGSPVVFEGLDGETGDWGGLRFADSAADGIFDSYGCYISGSMISCCEIRHAGDSAVSADRASPYLSRIRFEQNEARFDKGEEIIIDPDQMPNERIMGGAVYFYRPRKRACVIDCDFAGNSSAHVGGALAVAESYGTRVYLSGCNFTCNTAGERGGGAVRLLGASAGIFDCFFEGNDAERGGAIHASYGSELDLEVCSFESNRARKMGGAIFLAHDSSARVENSIFEDNAVDSESRLGGGAVCIHENGYIDFEECAITGNTAPTAGALLLSCNSKTGSLPVKVNCCSFYGNTALDPWRSEAIEAVDWTHIEITESTFANTCFGGIEIRVAVGVFPGRTGHAADFRGNYWEYGTSGELVSAVSRDPEIDIPEVKTGEDLETQPLCAVAF